MSGKRNISFTKPQDPSFLAKLKAQIGYREGPTVDTKRQKLEAFDSDNPDVDERPELDEEKPQIVVLQSGDLTEEQVAQEKARIAKELAEAPADLSKPIIFHKRKVVKDNKEAISDANTDSKSKSSDSSCHKKHADKQKSRKSKQAEVSQKNKLSFNDEDDENSEEDT